MKFFGLIWAALYRKPIRSILTLLSIFVAFLLFGLLQSVGFAFSQGADFSGVDRLVVAAKYSKIDNIPLSHANQIRGIDGVDLIAHSSWFGGTYKDNRSFFPRWPVPPGEYLEIYTEYVLPDDQKEAFINTRTSAIVGRKIAERYGLNVGDKMPIVPEAFNANKDNKTWEFDIVGIFDGEDDNVYTEQMFINYAYYDEYRATGTGSVGNIIVRIADPDKAAQIAGQIDRLFANSADETKTTTEKAFNQSFANQMGDIGFIMTSILSAVFFTILLLTGNTMAQGIRERIPELAILKTIGFSNVSILFLVLAESVFIALLGALPGLWLAGSLIPGLSQAVQFFNGIELTSEIMLQGVSLAVLLGLVVGLPSSIRAMRLNIVDALRKI